MEKQAAASTSPLIKDGKKLKRRFLGNITPKNNYEIAEKKAYLKGFKYFTYGMDRSTIPPSPNQFIVRQEYFYV